MYNKKSLGKWLLYPESVPTNDGDVTCTVPANITDVLRLRTKRNVFGNGDEETDNDDEWVVAPQTEKGADGKTKTYVEMVRKYYIY